LDDTIHNIAQGENLSLETFRLKVETEESNYRRPGKVAGKKLSPMKLVRGSVQHIYQSTKVDSAKKLMEEQRCR
jgi:hypothetical protein